MMANNKKYIPIKLKKYTSSLFDNKCYFCKKNLSDPKKWDKQYHHFIKECEGSGTEYDTLVLSCKDCHFKIHSKIKLELLDFRKAVFNIFCSCLNLKLKYSCPEEIWIIGDLIPRIEYLHFRKMIYIDLCDSLDILPITGDSYAYDDDLTFNGYSMISKEKIFLIKSVLSRLDKHIGKMNIKKTHSRPELNKSKTQRNDILKSLMELIDCIFIDNERSRLEIFISEYIKNIKSGNRDIEKIRNFVENNRSIRAKRIRRIIDFSKIKS